MSKKGILVTGGAGYIGAHTVYALIDEGYAPIVLDNLSTGVRDALPADIPFYLGSTGDEKLLQKIFLSHDIQGIVNFAGSIIVPESVTDPVLYYQNNTMNSLTLISAAMNANVKAFVFSSTAAVYGEPDVVPITEDMPKEPINPYGHSKLMTEQMLKDCCNISEMNYAALRYFNVAGADPKGRCGQTGGKATHLIKIACQAALGQRDHLSIFGTDYPTPDGTCIRDYIHVSDLAKAHALTLSHLLSGGESFAANCGYNDGFSVRKVIETMERVLGHSLAVTNAPRRDGDPTQLIAANEKLKSLVKWHPEHDDLEEIIRSALEWEKKLLLLDSQTDKKAL